MELAAARTEKIEKIIAERRIVTVNELCGLIGASPATIRRDLLAIERKGQARRVHGGAVSPEGRLSEPLFDDKTSIAAGEKKRIAEAAMAFIKPRDTVFLDGGSTILALASRLQGMNDLTVVTNSLRVVMSLSGNGPQVILVGGEFRRLSQTFVGSLSGAILDKLRVDTAFMGTIGLSASTGLTTTDPREAYTKELVMNHAGKIILLADSTKIGKVSFVRFGNMDALDVIVTDSGAPVAELQRFRKKEIRVITC